MQNFQDLTWSILKENFPSKNLEKLEPIKVNTEIWSNILHKTKSLDMQEQQM